MELTEASDRSLSTVETVYARIKQSIIRSEFEIGEKFFESDVAEMFGVSRTPAREALARILSEGLLVRSGRIYSVRTFSLPEVRELFAVREQLECLAAEVAAKNYATSDKARLEAIFSEMQDESETDDPKGFSILDQAFHMEIAFLSKNSFLCETLSLIQDRASMVRNFYLSRPHGAKEAQMDHRQLMSALRRGNSDVAAAEMRSHIRSSIARYTELESAR